MTWHLDGVANVGIRSAHHKLWMSAQPDGRVECNRELPLGWEMFEIRAVTDSAVSIRSVRFDRYLSAQPSGQVECNRTWVRGWELWKPVLVDEYRIVIIGVRVTLNTDIIPDLILL